MPVRSHVLNGLLALVAASGVALWVGPDHGAHVAASVAFLLAILWHMKRADRSQQRKGGKIAVVAVLIVAAAGIFTLYRERRQARRLRG